MKKNIIKLFILLNLTAMSFVSVSNDSNFSNLYMPKEMLTEFIVPLDSYLTMLADSSGYKYVPTDDEESCPKIKVPFHTPRHSILSNGELKTVNDHIQQLALIIPEQYGIEISQPEKEIKLICSSQLTWQ
tara:strand:+ start:4187 stop:4576 length:390 start_codon:yes stop_codon:yes gene_type:complete